MHAPARESARRGRVATPRQRLMSALEVKVPDIGDFTDIPVIEIFVKPGDAVKAEDSLVTLESDKATMDVPSPAAGTVKEVKVKLGDKVSEGSLIVVLESAAAGAAKPAAPAPDRVSPAARSRCASGRAGQAGIRTDPRRRHLRRQGRHRMPDARAGRRTGRLQRGIPRGRPRHEDGAGRALRRARRRVPQRRLHSVEGAACTSRRDGRDEGAGRARHRVRRAEDRPRSRSARGRTRSSAS